MGIGFVWAHRIGEWKASIKPIPLKKLRQQKRPKHSFFRWGLDNLRDLLTSFETNLKLFDEESIFHTRIKRIVSYGESLVNVVDLVKEKVRKTEELSQSEKEVFDILSFYESLELYQSPHRHSGLFNTNASQCNIATITNIAASDEIQSRGGLKIIYSEPLIYEENEIKSYLDELSQVLDNAEFSQKIFWGFYCKVKIILLL